MTARLYRGLFAVVGWGALALQYGLLPRTNPGSGAGELTLNFFSFFTILTNLLAALALTGPALAPDSPLGRWSRSEGVRAAVAMYIVVVGVVYHLLLAQTWNPQGWQKVADTLLHTVMPLAFVGDWLLFTAKGRLRWIDAVKWLAFPLLYGGWTLAHGAMTGWWPYWFVNVSELGLVRAAANFAGLLIFFLLLGLVVVAIDRAFGRRDRRLASA